jgi:DNA-binding PadR family transcriptional regulator
MPSSRLFTAIPTGRPVSLYCIRHSHDMDLDTLLLGLLRNRTASGYDLALEIDREESHLWRTSTSQVYATLRKLERRGLVESQPAPSRKGPPRRLYSLRPAGFRELEQAHEASAEHGAEWVPWLARLRILDGADNATAHRVLSETHAGLLGEYERLHALVEAAGVVDDPTVPGFYRRATLACALSTAETRLKWCGRILARVTALQDP